MTPTTSSPDELGAAPCSALDAALALIALGPQRSANAIEWCRVSLEMCRHCQGTENVNEAAARIVAEANAVLSDFARTAPGRLPSAVQDALAPWRPNEPSSATCGEGDSIMSGNWDLPQGRAAQRTAGSQQRDGSAYYGVRVEVVGDDRLSCSAHLRRIADMIMSGDAPGWTTSDVNGSANADRFTPNDALCRPADSEAGAHKGQSK